MNRTYPPTIEIIPLSRPAKGICPVPGSKSIGNRALILAALGTDLGPCALSGLLDSEDTRVMVDSLNRLGFVVEVDWPGCKATLSRPPGSDPSRPIPANKAELFVQNSGTTMRFVTAMCALGRGEYSLDGNTRMRERPIADLLGALRELGVSAWGKMPGDFPPLTIHSKGLNGGKVTMLANTSSQFLSGLLLAGPRALAPLEIVVEGVLVSEPYVKMTVQMLKAWGYSITKEGNSWIIPAPQKAQLADYAIEPDASAASYFWAAAAMTEGDITVPGLGMDSLQGDVMFLRALEQMGAQVSYSQTGVSVRGGSLVGIDIDMNAISDTVMTLGVVACFARGPTNIRNVGHIRHKETDRICALANELRRIGASVATTDDSLVITPPGPGQSLHGANIQTYDDHRMAMSLSLAGLKIPGIVIEDPGCVRKTYPGFFEDLEKLR